MTNTSIAEPPSGTKVTTAVETSDEKCLYRLYVDDLIDSGLPLYDDLPECGRCSGVKTDMGDVEGDFVTIGTQRTLCKGYVGVSASEVSQRLGKPEHVNYGQGDESLANHIKVVPKSGSSDRVARFNQKYSGGLGVDAEIEGEMIGLSRVHIELYQLSGIKSVDKLSLHHFRTRRIGRNH